MTDIGRKNQMEEVENMYIMMFSLQTLQNYGNYIYLFNYLFISS